MSIMRMIPGSERLLATLMTMGQMFKSPAPHVNRGYRGGGTGVGVAEHGRKATAAKPHIVSKIELRKRQKQSIRDRKLRYH